MGRTLIVFLLVLVACQPKEYPAKEYPAIRECVLAVEAAKTACEVKYPNTTDGKTLHEEFCAAASKEPLRSTGNKTDDEASAATCRTNADRYEKEALELIRQGFIDISNGTVK